MKQKLLLLATLLLTICLWSGVALAKNAHWVNRDVDFSAIKTVYIDDNIQTEGNVKISPLNIMYAKEYLVEKSNKLTAFQVVNDKDKADAIIHAEFLENNLRYYKVPEQKQTSHESVIVANSDGKVTTISVPVTKTIEGYTYANRYFTVKFQLTLPDGTKAYEYIDTREAPRAFENMLLRATRDFYYDLNKLKK